MSSWHLPTIHLTIVRDGLVQHEIMSKENADKFIIRIAKMNTYAIKCRYGDKVKVTKVHPTMCYNITQPALVKMLQCIQYQCSEGDVDIKHKTTWNMLKTTIGDVCASMYNETYGLDTSLPWAIFDKSELAKEKDISIPRVATAK
jgi:hypothetical protein